MDGNIELVPVVVVVLEHHGGVIGCQFGEGVPAKGRVLAVGVDAKQE